MPRQLIEQTKTPEPSSGREDAILRRARRFLPGVVVCVLSVGLGFRLFLVIWKYSVNLPFWDQWDFYRPLFDKLPLWRLFFWQHGPHREGLGLILDSLLLDLTHWSTRAEALSIGSMIFIAMLFAFRLKRKLFGEGFTISDVVIPLMFLTLSQWENFAVAPNLSYAALPLLLMMLYCLAWLQPDPLKRYGWVLLLNFGLIYTGFGFFMGLVSLFLLAAASRQDVRQNRLSVSAWVAVLLIALASLGSFFIHYAWNPTVDCFKFPYGRPLGYVWFVSLMFASFLGARTNRVFASVLGTALVLFALVVLANRASSLWRGMHTSGVDLVVAGLVAFSLLFSLGAAVGRICLGMEAAKVSRFATLLIPGFLGIYFHLLARPQARSRGALLAVFFLLLISGSFKGYRSELGDSANQKRSWKACYLKNENVAYCDRVAGSKIYWWPEGMHVQEKLQYLKERRLNLYAGPR